MLLELFSRLADPQTLLFSLLSLIIFIKECVWVGQDSGTTSLYCPMTHKVAFRSLVKPFSYQHLLEELKGSSRIMFPVLSGARSASVCTRCLKVYRLQEVNGGVFPNQISCLSSVRMWNLTIIVPGLVL